MARRIAALALTVLLFSGTASASPKPHEVLDLHYGEVLYHFYQKDYFTALTHLMAARKQDLLEHHELDSQLLLGGMQLSYGLLSEADRQFDHALAQTTLTEQHDRIRLYQGKLALQRGLFSQSLSKLDSIDELSDPRMRAEAALLKANAYMALRNDSRAADTLAKVRKAGDLETYILLNRGIALLRAGDLQGGRQVIDKLVLSKVNGEEAKALRDRANLAVGYELLKAGDAAEARDYLRRVRLRGPFMNSALLGAGWADAARGDYQAALIPWLTLKELARFDPPVQEAQLAVPYALMQLGEQQRAIQYYSKAIDYFDAEILALQDAQTALHSASFFSIVNQADPGTSGGWLQPDVELANVPAQRYLIELLSAQEFQESMKDYRDLSFLLTHLRRKLDNSSVYDDMLASRRQAHARIAPKIDSAINNDELGTLREAVQILQTRLEEQSRSPDPLDLATTEELARWLRLQKVLKQLSEMPDNPRYARMAERARWLQGYLYWQIQDGYKARLWEARKNLKSLSQDIAEAERRKRSLVSELPALRQRFEGFGRRIDADRARTRTLLTELSVARDKLVKRIRNLAIQELSDRNQRLVSYRNQARYALARGYDQLSAAQEPQP